MTIENVALVNELGQVVNHVVVDIDDTGIMDALHEYWGTVRHVVTKVDDVIILDESPEIWTTHCDNPDCETTGFNIPIVEEETSIIPIEQVIIGTRAYPIDSFLIKENAHTRPVGWVLPEDEKEVSLADAK